MNAHHEPVLLAETVELLAARRGGLFVDCTVGLGGHAEALLEVSAEVRVVGIDRDPRALARAAERLERFGERFHPVEGNFHRLGSLLEEAGGSVAGILADLGVSSMQLDTPERGFSFRHEGPLDMRMGREGIPAREILNSYSEAELESIFRDYGEERQARRIARAVVRRRAQAPFETTGELRELLAKAKAGARAGARTRARKARGKAAGRRHGPRESRIDPATQVFQALRIEVNQELAGLDGMIDEAVRLLQQDGRLVIISYHSLEDRIAKNRLRELARGEIDRITGRPRVETRLIEVLTRKPLRPSPQEVAANPRSRSARLRAARRI